MLDLSKKNEHQFAREDPIPELELSLSERVYKNNGNRELVDLIEGDPGLVLDVGCGAGDNAALIRSRMPVCRVFGITYSEAEAKLAQKYLEKYWVTDIEDDLPADIVAHSFDIIIFSHILEHLRHPDVTVARFAKFLRTGGQMLIAVPNVVVFENRMKVLFGDFRYKAAGIMDNTHLHFYTYFTAAEYLLGKSSELRLSKKRASGHVPLPFLRSHALPDTVSNSIDRWGMRFWPNLFGWQILIRAEKI